MRIFINPIDMYGKDLKKSAEFKALLSTYVKKAIDQMKIQEPLDPSKTSKIGSLFSSFRRESKTTVASDKGFSTTDHKNKADEQYLIQNIISLLKENKFKMYDDDALRPDFDVAFSTIFEKVKNFVNHTNDKQFTDLSGNLMPYLNNVIAAKHPEWLTTDYRGVEIYSKKENPFEQITLDKSQSFEAFRDLSQRIIIALQQMGYVKATVDNGNIEIALKKPINDPRHKSEARIETKTYQLSSSKSEGITSLDDFLFDAINIHKDRLFMVLPAREQHNANAFLLEHNDSWAKSLKQELEQKNEDVFVIDNIEIIYYPPDEHNAHEVYGVDFNGKTHQIVSVTTADGVQVTPGSATDWKNLKSIECYDAEKPVAENSSINLVLSRSANSKEWQAIPTTNIGPTRPSN